MQNCMLRVAFYKAKGNFIDTIVRLFTWSKYSHCELLFPDGRLFSSDGWESKGVRFTTKYRPDNWDILYIGTDTKTIDNLVMWCNTFVGKKYDWLGVLRFVFPFLKESKDKWFCSEICTKALQEIKFLDQDIKAYKITPKKLYRLIVDTNAKR